MEQQKKHWYQKWWGWFILFFFWVIAAPIAIFQSKLSPKAKKIGYGIYVVFLILGLIGAFGEKGSNTPIKNENKITVNKNESKAKKTTVIDETKQKQNIENNVKSEKKRVRDEFQKYESRHLKLWNDMTDAMQKSDVHSAYGYADEIKTVLFGIWQDLSKFKCNKTGDNEFDKQCEETVTLGENAYLAKQEAVNKLLKWFDDLQSPKKANEAKKSLEEGGEYWQVFLLKLTALTLTDEDLKDSKTKK